MPRTEAAIKILQKELDKLVADLSYMVTNWQQADMTHQREKISDMKYAIELLKGGNNGR